MRQPLGSVWRGRRWHYIAAALALALVFAPPAHTAGLRSMPAVQHAAAPDRTHVQTIQSSVVTAAVIISNFTFIPQTITVTVGTRVTWTNLDAQNGVPHTVSADDGTFSSDFLLGASVTYSLTFTQTGTIPYHCNVHPNMHGTVVVVAASPETSTPTNTPVPPTRTSTPTDTPIPPTRTSTSTNTPVPPTSTGTPTSTATHTIAPTATSSATPVPATTTDSATSTSTSTHTPVPTVTATNTPVPSATATSTSEPPTSTDTATNTVVPAASSTSTTTATSTSAASSTSTDTSTPTASSTSTSTSSGTPTPANSATATSTMPPTGTPTATSAPTDTPAAAITPTSTPTPGGLCYFNAATQYGLPAITRNSIQALVFAVSMGGARITATIVTTATYPSRVALFNEIDFSYAVLSGTPVPEGYRYTFASDRLTGIAVLVFPIPVDAPIETVSVHAAANLPCLSSKPVEREITFQVVPQPLRAGASRAGLSTRLTRHKGPGIIVPSGLTLSGTTVRTLRGRGVLRIVLHRHGRTRNSVLSITYYLRASPHHS